MILSTLDIFLLVLTFFGTIIGTLLVIVLMRVLSILGVVQEITNYYKKIKQFLNGYAQIPDTVKQAAKDMVNKK
ncbi:hypothetical protein MK079_04540 [Candidatus Gracilibacteria bacterium]|nr:hypothetical protein [Candidatus Gracilibacteria bacterium]